MLLVGLSAVAASGHVATRPALHMSAARARTSRPMMLASPLDAAHMLLANEAEAEEVGALLISQIGVSAAMIAAGFGLETFTEVAEEGVAQPEKEEGSTDIYRDSPLRYCGYANEVGEAFRPLVPVEFVLFSYVIAVTYILADTVDKGAKGAENGGAVTGTLGAIDTFCWQMLASVLFPSFIINRVVLLLVSLQAGGTMPELLNAGWLPTAAGLILIPLVILPLDILAHFTMNSSYRRIGNGILSSSAPK